MAILPLRMVRVGLHGFPNSGKTTLFNALTGLEAAAAPHPYTTTAPNLGVLKVPDPHLEQAAALERSRKTTHAAVEIHDHPAVRAGSGRGPSWGNELDAMAMVLRGHRADRVPAALGAPADADPAAQAEELLMETALADFEVFDRRRERIMKEASADPALRPAAEAVSRAADLLGEGIPLRTHPWSEAELRVFRDMAPLTLLPCIWVVNTADNGPDPGPGRTAAEDRLQEAVPAGDPVLAVSALIEEELVRFDPAEREELSEGLGLGEGAAAAMIRAVYQVLGLLRFYTLSSRESRAWAVPEGTTAREAAGKVHSDLERGFIRAEAAPIGEVIRLGGWAAARAAAGVVRVEGKDYEVRDGDVLLVRFSV